MIQIYRYLYQYVPVSALVSVKVEFVSDLCRGQAAGQVLLIAHHQQRRVSQPFVPAIDQITIMTTPNAKCRLYWCLVEFIDWRYIHVGISTCFVNYCPSTFFPVHLLPPFLCERYRSIQVYTVCNRWVRGSGCVESIYSSYTPCI
jgi:hypothetical protein